LGLILHRMRQRFSVVEHRAEIAHIKPTAHVSHLWKFSASLNGGPPVRLPMIVPRGESLRHACDQVISLRRPV
jgi:hypothetical protein